MAPRFETISAEEAQPAWLFDDADADHPLLNEIPEGAQALVLGNSNATALVIIGSVEDLRAFSDTLRRVTRGTPPERPAMMPSAEIPAGTRVRLSGDVATGSAVKGDGTVLEPCDVDLVAARIGLGDGIEQMVQVEWPGDRREWEFVEDLEVLDECERCQRLDTVTQLASSLAWLCADCEDSNGPRVVV